MDNNSRNTISNVSEAALSFSVCMGSVAASGSMSSIVLPYLIPLTVIAGTVYLVGKAIDKKGDNQLNAGQKGE